MTTTTAPTPLHRTPAAIVAVRVLLAVQVAIGVTAAAMTGMLLLLALAFAASEPGSGGVVAVIGAILTAGLILNILLVRGLFVLRRGRTDMVVTLTVVEVLLGTTLLVLLSQTGIGWGVGAWSSAPVIDLVCCIAVPVLLHSPAARRWTDPAAA